MDIIIEIHEDLHVDIINTPIPVLEVIMSLVQFTSQEQLAIGQMLLHRYIDRYNTFYMDWMDIQGLCDSLLALIRRWGPVYTWYEPHQKYSFYKLRFDIIQDITYEETEDEIFVTSITFLDNDVRAK